MNEILIHSELGASSTERWFNCPGSVSLGKGIPEPPPSSYAAEGSCAHEVVSQCLKNNLSAWWFIGEKFYDVEVTEEMAEHCQIYLTYVNELYEKLKPSCSMFVERKVIVWGFNNELWGTADALLCEFLGVLHVIDFKFGRGYVVEAEENTQALYYALAAIDEHHKNFSFSSVRITIVQPRAFHLKGPIRHYDISVEKVLAFRNTLEEKVQDTKKLNPVFQVGEWCRWCKAASVCPELNNQVAQATNVQFNDLDVSLINIQDLQKALQAIPSVKNWVSSVETCALHIVEKGTPIPGFKLVERRTNRKWKDPESVETYLKNFKVSSNIIYKKKLNSPKQILEQVPNNFHSVLEPFIEKPFGGYHVVPEDDSRPEVTQIEIVPKVDFPEVQLVEEVTVNIDNDFDTLFDQEFLAPKKKRGRKKKVLLKKKKKSIPKERRLIPGKTLKKTRKLSPKEKIALQKKNPKMKVSKDSARNKKIKQHFRNKKG